MAVCEAKYKHFEEKTQNILEAANLSSSHLARG